MRLLILFKSHIKTYDYVLKVTPTKFLFCKKKKNNMALFQKLYQTYHSNNMNLKLGETLLSLQHSKPSQIPEFAQDQISQIKQEIKRLQEEIKKMYEDKKNIEQNTIEYEFKHAKLALLLDQMYRIKRFLLIYYNFRCERIEDQFWMFGGDLNNKEKDNLTEQEKAYFAHYKGLVIDYVEEVAVDLLIDLDPPLESEVEVRMLQDCGELLDENGHVVKLEKNACFFMRRRLIEPYVKQGFAVIKTKK